MYKGKMSKIRQEGRVDAAVLIDTILTTNMYAVGPVKDLLGEIIVWKGRAFVAGLTEDTRESFVKKDVKNLEAVFLVYADVPRWDTIILLQDIASIQELQKAITAAAIKHGTDTTTAFPFLLHGKVKSGSGHIMFKDSNVTTISSETLAQAKHINTFNNQRAQMLGFYSQHHQGVFTHHDSFLHIHYRMWNKYQAGHLDEVVFDSAVPLKLLLPYK
jgi:acetolactate decarboxylase